MLAVDLDPCCSNFPKEEVVVEESIDPQCDLGEGIDDEESVESQAEPASPTPPRPPLNRQFPRRGPKNTFIRRSKMVDIETGSSFEHTCVCLGHCESFYNKPMDPKVRMWDTLFHWHQSASDHMQSDLPPNGAFQYRLTSRIARRGLRGFFSKAAEEDFQAVRGLNVLIANYLMWTLQAHSFLVFLSAAVMYIVLSGIFAALIFGLARYKPYCLQLNGEDWDHERGHTFEDAFALSWQTFSTAGYGAVRPAPTASKQGTCALMNMVAVMDSFTGVLFIGFCTAVMFGKIARVHMDANVTFSDPIVVRYGGGVMPSDEDVMSDSSSVNEGKGENQTRGEAESSLHVEMHGNDCPCPILEFRVLNNLHDQLGGEICNATIKVVSITKAHRIRSTIKRKSIKRRLDGAMSTVMTSFRASGGELQQNTRHRAAPLLRSTTSNENRNSDTILHRITHSLMPRFDHRIPESAQPVQPYDTSQRESPCSNESLSMPVTVDEEPSGKLAPRRAFTKIEIETDQHPYFKRVWTIRHVLNDKSPLLSEKARLLMEENRGKWPNDLNNYKAVREHIHFHQIIVSFSGIANVSGSSVYYQKVYDYADMNVGYRFAGMLLKGDGGRLIVDTGLLNDVLEQHGGGGEPFTNVLITGNSIDAAIEAAAKVSVDVVKKTADVAVSAGKATVQAATDAAGGRAQQKAGAHDDSNLVGDDEMVPTTPNAAAVAGAQTILNSTAYFADNSANALKRVGRSSQDGEVSVGLDVLMRI